MSTRVVNPRPQISVQEIATELSQLKEHIIPAIKELKFLRLIHGDVRTPAVIKLTLLGCAVTG